MAQAASWDHTPERWEQVREFPGDMAVTPVSGRPDSARPEFEGAAYDRVSDTGFSMLVAWLVGPDHLVRLPDRERHAVTVTTVQGTRTTISTESRTQADQDMIDDAIDEYLADAHVPSPPRGYRWYQRLPRGCDSLNEAYARINLFLRDSDSENNAVRPVELAPLMADAVADLYQR